MVGVGKNKNIYLFWMFLAGNTMWTLFESLKQEDREEGETAKWVGEQIRLKEHSGTVFFA